MKQWKHASVKKGALDVRGFQFFLLATVQCLINHNTIGVQSANCKESNVVSSKLGARVVLRGLLDLPLEEDAIPLDVNGITNTVVDAEPVQVVPGVEVEQYSA